MSYFETALTLSPYQKEKIASAVRNKKSTTIRLAAGDLSPNPDSVKIRLTKQQIAKIKKSRAQNVGVVLRLSKTQLSKQGGFLGGLLGGLAASLLPSLLGSGMVLPGTTGKGNKKRARQEKVKKSALQELVGA